MLILSFILGAAAGSFVNLLAARTVAGQSPIVPRSFCDACTKALLWFDNIPIFSFFLLRARCRFCRSRISYQYPIIEAVTGLLFVFAASRAGALDWQLIASWIAMAALVALFLTDFRAMVLPDRITLPAIVLLLLIDLVFLQVSILSLFLAVLLGAGFFLVQYLVSRGEWVGSGDIRLGLLMAVILISWQKVALALAVAYVIGAIISLPLLILKKKNLKSEIPLGTFLVIGTLVVMLM